MLKRLAVVGISSAVILMLSLILLSLPSCDGFPWPIPIPTPPPTTCYDCDNPPALAGVISTEDPVRGQYIVVLNPTRAALGPKEIEDFAKRFKGVSKVQTLVRAFAAKIEEKNLSQILSDPAVDYIQQVGKRKLVALSWGLDRIDQRELPLNNIFDPTGTCKGVHIVINDTGVTEVDDTRGRVSDQCFSTITFRGCQDGHGHGTHVAGTAAGTTWGICRDAIIHSARFLDENGSGTDTDAIRTIDKVIEWKLADPSVAWVLNASWGGSAAPAVNEAVCRAIKAGVVFVAAAGNESDNACTSTPAQVKQVITVGASDRTDKQAYFSNFGEVLDLYAPGVDIESDTPTGGTAVYSGTSMATPHVVGAAGLYVEGHGSATPAQVEAALVAKATEGVLTGIGSGSPNRLLFIGKEGGGGLPPKDELVGEEMILRTDYATLMTVIGVPVKLNQQSQCCMSLIPSSGVRRPASLRVGGVEINTLWPCQSEEAQDYFFINGRSNGYICRGGPFRTDVSAEVDWIDIGGPYLLGPNGEWTPEWNPAHWQKKREMAWHGLQNGMYHFEVVIDTWGCKYDQNLGDARHYMLWPVEAIEACGRTWHPEHERYVRKVVEELGCFGNVVWELDNEGQGVQGWKAEWFQQLLVTIKEEEIKHPCRQRITGTSVPGVGADYRITHDRAPLPHGGTVWLLNNERNPAFSPELDTQYFVDAGGLGWSLWRDGWSQAQLEEALARRKAVVDGIPLPTSCPKLLEPGASVYLNDNPYGHGFDSSPRVKDDPEFCRLIHGTAVNDCNLEGWPERSKCEMELLRKHGGSCPVWECKTSAHPEPMRCLQPRHDVCSCDHWGTAGGAQDDPHTPEYEGQPVECADQQEQGFPAAGFYTVARGKGDVRACLPDGTGCGPWRFFDRDINAEP